MLEQGLLPAGETRSYTAAQVARVVLGNAPAVTVRQAGEVVDLTPFTRANVAAGGATWAGGNIRGTLKKIIAIALTDRSAGGTATIWFNGDEGFGYDGQDGLT